MQASNGYRVAAALQGKREVRMRDAESSSQIHTRQLVQYQNQDHKRSHPFLEGTLQAQMLQHLAFHKFVESFGVSILERIQK
jgi:hypothetical protein